ncbi:MAG: SDR family oxidoreductase [Elusimicrobiota bacterium]|nr:SDR family oxidoreductase [Elusimicrobiota bacterium]
MSGRARLALVTGASTGFGKGLVAALLERGWAVAATMRGAESRRDLFAAEAAAHAGRLHLLSLDVADAAQRAAAAAWVEAAGGRLDLLVNNAGYGLFGALEDLSEEQLRRQFEVNFFGATLLTRALLPSLRAARGKVLNLSSVLGFTAFPLASAYCASKFALEGLSESLAYELAPHGVQVCAVQPGRFATRFTDNSAWGERSMAPDSPYRRETDGYARLRERLTGGSAPPQAAVVEALARLAEARRIPRRLRLGRDAAALGLVEALLPDEWARRLLGFVYDRALMR